LNQQWNVPPVPLQVHNVKRFWVLNLTSMAYSFAWEALDAGSSGAAASPFQCSTMTGVLAPGKRYEMVFQYTPNEDKLQVCKPPLH
jgi:hydrocephalus-inducing protein